MSDNKQDLSALVARILEHPELVAEITGLLNETATDEKEGERDTVDAPTAAEAPPESRGHPKNENRKKLLAALRPFLSEKRRGALDSLETVATLLEITGA